MRIGTRTGKHAGACPPSRSARQAIYGRARVVSRSPSGVQRRWGTQGAATPPRARPSAGVQLADGVIEAALGRRARSARAHRGPGPSRTTPCAAVGEGGNNTHVGVVSSGPVFAAGTKLRFYSGTKFRFSWYEIPVLINRYRIKEHPKNLVPASGAHGKPEHGAVCQEGAGPIRRRRTWIMPSYKIIVC
jgi:hypothetical protein